MCKVRFWNTLDLEITGICLKIDPNLVHAIWDFLLHVYVIENRAHFGA